MPKNHKYQDWNVAKGTANGEWLEYKQVLKQYFNITAKPPKQKLVRK